MIQPVAADEQPVVEIQSTPVPEAAPAPVPQKVKTGRGVGLVFAIITAALCGLALVQLVISFNINLSQRVLFSPSGIHYFIQMLAFAIGIATGILAKKLPALAIIPLPIVLMANIINIGYVLTFYIRTNKSFSDVLMYCIRPQMLFIVEILVSFVALTIYIIAAVTRKKAGAIFGGISLGVFAILTVITMIEILRPLLGYIRMPNLNDMLMNLRFRFIYLSRVPFYASYIALSIGLMRRRNS